MSKDEVKRVKDVARGQWPEILAHAGIPQEHLKGTHGPCPKCGGKDRFRCLDDWVQTGSSICNQCNSEGSGDGFSTIMWWLGCDFTEAVQKVADFVGIKRESTRNGSAKAAKRKQLDFIDWNDGFANLFLMHNEGVKVDAIRLAGGRMAKHFNRPVMSFPTFGENGKTVGHVIMSTIHKTLKQWDKDGNVTNEVRHRQVKGSKSGLVGKHAVKNIHEDCVCIKCEGLSDSLAVQSAIPEPLRDHYLVVTNASGDERKPKVDG